MKLQAKRKLTALIMSIPAMIFFVVLVYYPIAYTFFLGFTDFELMTLRPHFVGLAQFKELLVDTEFQAAICNTFMYVGSTAGIGIPLALLLALVIAGLVKSGSIYSFIYFVPVVSPVVAVCMVWWWMYEPQVGILNYSLSLLGLPPRSWLKDPDLALSSIIVVGIWQRFGFNTLIFVAGLKNIPNVYYDAGKVDGATKTQLFRHITLPLLAPITFFVIILTIINSFQVFAYIYTMTQGGPAGSTQTVVYTIYTSAFKFFDFGYAAAMAVILFLIIMGFTGLQLKIFGRGS